MPSMTPWHHGDSVMPIMQKLCKTEILQADMCSCSQVALSHGNQKAGLHSVVNYRSRILCIGTTSKKLYGSNKFAKSFLCLLTILLYLLGQHGCGCSVQQSCLSQRVKAHWYHWHFVWDLIWSKTIHTSPIPGFQNGADFLTKALNRFEHECCVKL